MIYCDYNDWIKANSKYKDWYLKKFPYILEFPIPFNTLQNFYELKMTKNNLDVDIKFYNCYEAMLDFYLSYYKTDQTIQKGKTFFDNLFASLDKSYTDITTSVDKYIYFILIGLGLLVLFEAFKNFG